MNMRSLLLVHGAGSGPWVFEGWEAHFPGMEVKAIDLQEDLDVARASMVDYRERVISAARAMEGPVALCGWSMGGLVALMAAEMARCAALVLLEPSPPGEVQGFDPRVHLQEGTFDPEVAYGRFPPGVRSRSESLLARCERKRGISISPKLCPALVIAGNDFALDRGEPVATFLDAKYVHLPGSDHWDLLSRPEVIETVRSFLTSTAAHD